MPTHIALLRGINVGGRNRIAMAALRDLCAKLKLPGAKSLLQSGNLIFECDRMNSEELELLLERETAKQLKVPPDYVVRTAEEWRRIVVGNPFPDEAKLDPGHLVVMFMKDAPSAKAIATLAASIKGREVLRADRKQLYIVYPDGIGTSKLTNTLIERALGVRGTARNWNTVLKITAVASAVAFTIDESVK